MVSVTVTLVKARTHGRERRHWRRLLRAAFVLIVVLGQGGARTVLGQSVAVPDTLCDATALFGHVVRGETFDAAVTEDLRFRLAPSRAPNPEGWTIQVTGTDPSRDYLMIATPPYRFGNPRYLDTSYGTPAEAALAWSPRTFQFVLNDADFDTMDAAVGVLLWPADHDPLEIERAGRVVETTRKGSGTFEIIDGAASPADDNHPLGRIEWVTFKVEVCL